MRLNSTINSGLTSKGNRVSPKLPTTAWRRAFCREQDAVLKSVAARVYGSEAVRPARSLMHHRIVNEIYFWGAAS
jgi:hypothetical protein